mmetsp:Transcript_89714/g.159438  ORF Transcript_89714/g.159438 Transcript_89714/m.159438 type:complete len:307 (+) Transcript_89714:108-1028(+)
MSRCSACVFALLAFTVLAVRDDAFEDRLMPQEDGPKEDSQSTQADDDAPSSKKSHSDGAPQSKRQEAEDIFHPALEGHDSLQGAAKGIEDASDEAKKKAELLSEQFKSYQNQMGKTRELLDTMSEEVSAFKDEVTDYFADAESDKYSPIALEAKVDKKTHDQVKFQERLAKENGCVLEKCLENKAADPDCCSNPSTASCSDGYHIALGARCADGQQQVCCTKTPVQCDADQCMSNGGADEDCCAPPLNAECDNDFAKIHGAECGLEVPVGIPKSKQVFCCKAVKSSKKQQEAKLSETNTTDAKKGT